MKLLIDLPIQKRAAIDRFCGVFLLGSCFADLHAHRFKHAGFGVTSNPFGIVYNPYTLQRIVEQLVSDKDYRPDEFTVHEGRWFHPDHHGTLEFDSRDEAVEQCNARLKQGRSALRNAGCIVLTLGTALVFEHTEDGRIVGNCHSIPSDRFSRIMLQPEAVTQQLETVNALLTRVNPNAERVVTVSPVRHIRSGVVQSNLSKAILRTAIHQAGLDPSYFPSYEIFIDELRDYRFSEQDLVHPNPQAGDYIWRRFVECMMTPRLAEDMREVEAYHSFKAHIPVRDPALHARQVDEKGRLLLQRYPDLSI